MLELLRIIPSHPLSQGVDNLPDRGGFQCDLTATDTVTECVSMSSDFSAVPSNHHQKGLLGQNGKCFRMKKDLYV